MNDTNPGIQRHYGHLQKLLTLLTEHSNKDGYVLMSRRCIADHLAPLIGWPSVSDVSVKSALATLEAIGCVEMYLIAGSMPVNPKSARPIYKVLKDNFSPEDIELSADKRRILELEAELERAKRGT